MKFVAFIVELLRFAWWLGVQLPALLLGVLLWPFLGNRGMRPYVGATMTRRRIFGEPLRQPHDSLLE